MQVARRFLRGVPGFLVTLLPILLLVTLLGSTGCSNNEKRRYRAVGSTTEYQPEVPQLATHSPSTTPATPSAPQRVSGPSTVPVSRYSANRTVAAWPTSAPTTIAESAIMVDARNGRVLYHKNPDERRAVASTQKLLTALVILDAGNLNKPVRITREAASVQPSKLYLKEGEVYTRMELLKGIMIKSANDAAIALAIDHSGSVAEFAYAMNRKARSLGARNSNFMNPHGLTEDGQFSTARDVAAIALAAYREPVLRRYMKTGHTTFTHNSGRVRNLKNTNHLVRTPGIYTGMKTGFTYASGRCLVSSASKGLDDVILVQLGGTRKLIFDDAARMLNWQLNRNEWSLAGN